MEDIDKLRKTRRGKKAALTRVLGLLKTKTDDPTTLAELIQRADRCYEEVEAAHQRLCELVNDDDFDEEDKWMEACQEDYWTVKEGVMKQKETNSDNSSIASSVDNDVFNQFSDLKLALELPKAHINEFNGNPVEYWSFINNFKVNVAPKVSNDNARLQYLLQLCKGKAKACIESCALLEKGGYEVAMALLRKQFGQPHMILNGLINDMLSRKRISNGDGEGLWDLVSAMKKCEAILSQMGFVNDLNSTSTLLKIQSLLPIGMQNGWADKAHDILEKREPTFSDMVKYIEKRAEVSCNMFGRCVGKSGCSDTKEQPRVRNNNIQTKRTLTCFHCEQPHMLTSCDDFLNMTYDERVQVARDKRLCYRCLVKGHSAAKCRREVSCGKCHSTRHHELIHPPSDPVVTSNAAISGKNVYLMIIPVEVTALNGNRCTTLALLDNGSDSSLCSDSLRRKLGVGGQRVRYTSVTINGEENKNGLAIELTVKGMHEKREIGTKVLTVGNIPSSSDAVPNRDELRRWDHLRDLPANDTKNLEVELLISADTPEAFWVIDERRANPKDPYAVKTPLGWCVMGPGLQTKTRSICHRITVTNEQLLDQLKKTWTIDDGVLEVDEDSVEDMRAKTILDRTTILRDDGHYESNLLWKHDEHQLPCNKPMAETRLRNLKTKLDKDVELKKKYAETLDSYIAKGYAEPVSGSGREGNVWYLPHHVVTNPKKPDKIRVVFDCAARWCGTSLNDKLLKGPEMNSDLVGVLLRFRRERIALVADIESMYHQVYVTPDDRDVLRFLWWKGGDTNTPAKEFRMKVHVFGATSSPCCARNALIRSADDNVEDNDDDVGKATLDVIRNSFYVDDCLVSTANPTFAMELVERLRHVLSKGGFRLTKWLSNHKSVMSSIPNSERAKSVPINPKKSTLPSERTLGVIWDAERDVFKFEVDVSPKAMTRRGLLSVTSSIFDPLGFAAPFILFAKSLLQDVCRRGSEWDEALGESEVLVWKRWLDNTSNLSNVQVPRWMQLESADKMTLHIFCDASEKGYAACAYCRTISSSGEVDVVFVMGKAKVTPLKKVSIPRLELLAAVLAVKLKDKVKREIGSGVMFESIVFWSDSMVVLGYIKNETKRFKTFVANRVACIRGTSKPEQWRHVPTTDNPADEGSRGTLQLKHWIVGPEFLRKNETTWPTTLHQETQSSDPEVKIHVNVNQTRVQDSKNVVLEELIEGISSWTKLIRVYAYVRRFITRCKGATAARLTSLSVAEIEGSELNIISWTQRAEFPRWKSEQRLKKLQPILMGDVLRVGGRIDQATVSNTMKHPMILPAYAGVSKLIIQYYHKTVGHGGWMSTLNALRSKFWLLQGRTAVKSALHRCTVCKRYGAKPEQQVMADLPAERLQDGTPPFTNVGVDFFGPFEVKVGRSMVKKYGCIFTCLVSRAIHLELACGLDTDAFINALRRFVARRGQPRMFVSDNGTNLHGGERELRESIQKMKNERIEDFCHTRGFQWKFNPAHASHFGGVWERLIRSVRRTLNGVLKEQRLTEDVLSTALIEVENILNSRPITGVSSDHQDPEPLTPNHLLLLREGPFAPVEGITDKSVCYGRRRWLHVQYLASLFWTRWRKEYLPLLQRRNKWTTPKENVRVNDIVLLVDETTPRGKWPLGRVLSVRTSNDGKVRSVDVKVNNNVLKRPISKLCIVC